MSSRAARRYLSLLEEQRRQQEEQEQEQEEQEDEEQEEQEEQEQEEESNLEQAPVGVDEEIVQDIEEQPEEEELESTGCAQRSHRKKRRKRRAKSTKPVQETAISSPDQLVEESEKQLDSQKSRKVCRMKYVSKRKIDDRGHRVRFQ